MTSEKNKCPRRWSLTKPGDLSEIIQQSRDKKQGGRKYGGQDFSLVWSIQGSVKSVNDFL